MTKVALVTGGTRGIGRAISERLVKDGFKVAANYAGNDEAAGKCAEELGLKCYKWDVGDYDACAEGIAKITKDLGPVDVLVNNAGITRDATLHRMTRQQWDDVIRVDLTSAFNLCRLTIESMRERNYGRIVNISSINGQKGQVGQVNYSAAKAGLIGFTKALAQENAKKGITVNVICPGYIDTEMVQAVPEKVLESIIATIPVGRLGKAEEIAACVSFLSGQDSGFITGATLTANGGQFIAG
ncbi:MAG: acetoacetyl-CoA reductase [Hyphomonadaceae bacterium]